MSDRKDHIRNLNALNAICGQKDFYDKEMEESLRFAINSLKVDEAYQLEYEKRFNLDVTMNNISIALDELKEIREEIDKIKEYVKCGYTKFAKSPLRIKTEVLAILNKKISELEGKE